MSRLPSPSPLRSVAALALALAVALPLAFPLGSAQARRRPPPDPAPVPIPVQHDLIAHEWGVWVLEGGRQVALAELAAEVPPFVHRAPAVGPAPPLHHRPPAVSRKPVLFLYATGQMQVRVQVGFTGGTPRLHYPAAQAVAGPTGGGLHWDLRVSPNLERSPAPVVAGHFWHDLRAAGASYVTAVDGTTERFLFYDGPVAFEPSFLVQHRPGGAQVSPTSTERVVYLIEGDRFVEAEVDPNTHASRALLQGDMEALRTRLAAEAMARGLTSGETTALLDTWRDELFAPGRRRAVYFVPREAYDRMLPLAITPAPSALVRVGLVIDRG